MIYKGKIFANEKSYKWRSLWGTGSKFVNGVHPQKRNIGNENWIAKTPNSYGDMANKIKKIKSDVKATQNIELKVQNIVLTDHGISYSDGTKALQIPGVENFEINSTTIELFLDVKKNGQNVLKKYDAPTQEYLNNSFKYVQDLENLMLEINDGGSLILLNCGIASDENLMKSLSDLGDNRINVVAQTKVSTVAGNRNGSYNVLDAIFNRGEGVFKVIGEATNGVLKNLKTEKPKLNSKGNAVDN